MALGMCSSDFPAGEIHVQHAGAVIFLRIRRDETGACLRRQRAAASAALSATAPAPVYASYGLPAGVTGHRSRVPAEHVRACGDSSFEEIGTTPEPPHPGNRA